MTAHRTLPLIVLAAVLASSGCSRDTPPATPASAPAPAEARSAIASAAGKVMEDVRDKLETRNFSLSADEGLPKAEITPEGELLVDGKPVAVTREQRALLLEYRKGIVAVATAGADIGMQGADFGMQAAGMALRGVFSGKDEKALEAQIEAEAKKFEQQAMRICDLMPPLLDAQQKLAAQLPAFEPYATMDQSDVDDCRSNH